MIQGGGEQLGRAIGRLEQIDITDLTPHSIVRGSRAEIIGPNIAIDEVAAWSGTISYELLTRLGSGYARLYSGIESDATA